MGARLTLLVVAGLTALSSIVVMAQELEVIAGFATPESVAFDAAGRVYVSNIGGFNPDDPDGDGRIVQLDAQGQVLADPFAAGLNDPKGLAFDAQGRLVASDVSRLWRISPEGDVMLFAEPQTFPVTPQFLNDVAAGPAGALWVSDSGAGRLFRVSADGEVSLAEEELAGINGLLFDPNGNLLLAVNDRILRRRAPGAFDLVADGFRGLDGLAFDALGNLYASEFSRGRVTRILDDGTQEVVIEGQASAADLGINPLDGALWVANFKDDAMLRLPPAPLDIPNEVMGEEMPEAIAERLMLTLNPQSGPIEAETISLRFVLEPLALLDATSLRIEVGDDISLDVSAIAELVTAGLGALEVEEQLVTLEFAGLPFPLPGLPLPLPVRFQAATTAGELSVVERAYSR